MYRILNKLFGWDYIAWTSYLDAGVSRVFVDGRGNPYYWQYDKYVESLEKPKHDITWLTCPPSKYLKTEVVWRNPE